MINLGNSEISAVYLGAQDVTSEYLESTPEFNLENSQAKGYMDNVDYSDNPAYTLSYIENYIVNRDYTIWSKPAYVVVRWNVNTSGVNQKIYIGLESDYSDAWEYEIDNTHNSYKIYNLIPQKTYYYKVVSVQSNSSEIIIKEGTLETLGHLRMLNIDGEGVGNFRDLGGWALPNNKRTKYGILIRGAEVLRHSSFNIEISQAGIYELKNRLGCTVELDFGDFGDESPLEAAGFEFIHGTKYNFYAYDDTDNGFRSQAGRQKFKNSIEAIISRIADGKVVYFHCNSGADRTGTMAFVIEGLLGVSDSDKSKDYELTSFWTYYFLGAYNYLIRKRNQTPGGSATYGYNTMVAYINDTFNGSTLNEKIYNMCILPIADGGIGLSVSDIETLRSIMIE